MSRTKIKSDKILQAVLTEVPFDGWTDSAYLRGLKMSGITQGEAALLFPQGIRDVIAYFGDTTDDHMMKRLKSEPGFSRLRVRDKIKLAVQSRLEILAPHREAVRRMLFWYATPLHVSSGIKRLYKTVDLMWQQAGDTSTDFNYYTKRILLAGILKSTTVVWLDDETPGFQASWAFLERRISEVLKIGKSISLLKEWTPKEWVEKAKAVLKRA